MARFGVGEWVAVRQVGQQGQFGQIVGVNRSPFAMGNKYAVRIANTGEVIMTGYVKKIPKAWIRAWNAQTRA